MVSRQFIMRQRCSKFLTEDLKGNILFSKLVSDKPFLGLLVTKNDQVYALGADENDYFGLGPVTEIPKLTKIDSLCGKNICQFAACSESDDSNYHMLALSESGVVYAWGYDSSGQLGDDSKTTLRTVVPTVVGGDLEDKVVKQIGCGGHSSVALTEDGEVFTWGANHYDRTGHGSDRDCTMSPKIVKGLLTHRVVVKISCNIDSILCLDSEWKIFAFGYNGYGNLGIGNTTHQFRPVLVDFQGHLIHDITCGSDHTLALTDQGIILAWGRNDKGQIGIGSKTNVTLPTRIKLDVDRTSENEVVKILAECDNSFAMDTEGTVYYWGSLSGQDFTRPTVSDISFPESLNECKFRSAPKCCHSFVFDDLLKSFDDKATSDFVITVEGKDIHVHKAILRIRSPYFETMFNNDWKETENNRIVIEHYSYDVYQEFLRYIYRGEVRDLSPELNMRLLDLATMALDDRLAQLCSKKIKKQLEVGNLIEVFSLSLTLQKEELVNHCVRWAVNKGIKAIVASDAFREIPAEHVREFDLKCLANGGYDCRLKHAT